MPSRMATAALAAACMLAVTTNVTAQASAQTWPQQQPIRLVVGLAAGGLTDTIARVIAQPLGERIGQSVVVENRPGASGTIAAEQVARAPADGYTLLMGNTPMMSIVPGLLPTRYDPVQDFAPISIVGNAAYVLCVNPKLPVNNLAEFVEYVRKQPGKLSYASGGVGNITHLSMAYFLKLSGLEMINVPYKGGALAMSDLIAGHIPAMFATTSDALPQAKAGTIKILAVSSPQRLPQLPDLPTVAELGYPQFRTMAWNGLMAPAKTPKDIVDRLSREVSASLKEPKVLERLNAQGIDPVGNTPDDFAATIKSDTALWSEVIGFAGVKAK